MVALLFTLSLIGCADKKGLDVANSKQPLDYGSANNNGTAINGGQYENVDKYGGRGVVGGEYSDNASYGNGSFAGVQNIYFGVDQYTIGSDKLHIVSNNAKLLKGSRVKVEGHCDATGTDEYNYALGLKRAKAAKDAIVNRGIKSSDITIVSMGESSPECTTGFSSDCFSKNRRVEFKEIR